MLGLQLTSCLQLVMGSQVVSNFQPASCFQLTSNLELTWKKQAKKWINWIKVFLYDDHKQYLYLLYRQCICLKVSLSCNSGVNLNTLKSVIFIGLRGFFFSHFEQWTFPLLISTPFLRGTDVVLILNLVVTTSNHAMFKQTKFENKQKQHIKNDCGAIKSHWKKKKYHSIHC